MTKTAYHQPPLSLGTPQKLDVRLERQEIVLDGATVKWQQDLEQRRSYRQAKKARVFVWASEEFNVLEDLANRTRRPHQIWKPLVLKILEQVGISDVKLRWSQRAGCSCPCSPGFIIEEGMRFGLRDGDIFIHMIAPTVDESKPARQLV